jgi:transcriptional regulator with XRE-family HTH domain
VAKKSRRLTEKQRQAQRGKIRNRFKILLLQKAVQEGEPISLREVARRTGVNVSTWSAWLNNRVTRYDADKLAALCEFFGCTPGDLLEYLPPRTDQDGD